MAYMSQETKKELTPGIKAVLKKYGMKGFIAVVHHSTLLVRLKEGKLFETLPSDRDYLQLATCSSFDSFEGEEREFLEELSKAMNVGNWDKSDLQTDYFNVGWYSNIYIGKYDAPYKCTKKAA